MTIFYLGLALFFIPHFYSALRSRADGKDMRLKIGEAKYMGLYSVVTAIGLGLIIWGYIKTPAGEAVFLGSPALYHYSWVIMIPALILLICAYAPFGYIKRSVKHPMMLATWLWACIHLAMGGDLKRVLLFGCFAAYALVSLACAYKRGDVADDNTPNIMGDVISIIAGLVLGGILLHGGHEFLFGVSAV